MASKPTEARRGFPQDLPVLTVSQLTRRIKDLIEANFPLAWVQGEVSNCTRAGSGHIYFTLKDESAQLRAILWRSAAAQLKFQLQDGMEVVAAGPVEVYQARGSYQLIVEQIIPQGLGALELAFRQLQEKLAAEGLFDVEHKRPLPRFPRHIALITSPSGAAVRDVLQVISRRWPAVRVTILPVSVQGAAAAEEIAAAVRLVPKIPDVDVVITGRGGGSLEDLWAFNEETVARAIYACPIPVVCGVGHEIDVTIADLVADRRALTPTEAAELAVPKREELHNELGRLQARLTAALRERAVRARTMLDALASRRIFTRPMQAVQELAARVDELDVALRRCIARRMSRLHENADRLAGSLHALSPFNVLKRGYSITLRSDTGEVIRQADQLHAGQSISTLVERGRVTSRVEIIDPEFDAFEHAPADGIVSNGEDNRPQSESRDEGNESQGDADG